MSKFLKGNYSIQNSKAEQKRTEGKEEKDFTAIFEKKALERLGGSIAFVMKGKQFILEEDESA